VSDRARDLRILEAAGFPPDERTPPAKPCGANCGLAIGGMPWAVDFVGTTAVLFQTLFGFWRTFGDSLKRGIPPTEKDSPTRKPRKISAEGRARIAAAQRKRWAKTKRK
jgi:hypothetical protein